MKYKVTIEYQRVYKDKEYLENQIGATKLGNKQI